MSTDVAAIVSQLDIGPSKWKSVEFVWYPNGGADVKITPKRGTRVRIIHLPDYEATRQFGSWLRGQPGNIDVEAPVNSPTPGKVAA